MARVGSGPAAVGRVVTHINSPTPTTATAATLASADRPQSAGTATRSGTAPISATANSTSNGPEFGSVDWPLPRLPSPWPNTQNSADSTIPVHAATSRNRRPPNPNRPVPTRTANSNHSPTPPNFANPLATDVTSGISQSGMSAPVSVSATAAAVFWPGNACSTAPPIHTTAQTTGVHAAGAADPSCRVQRRDPA